MNLTTSIHHALAEELNQAEKHAVPIESLSKRHSEIDEEDAYAIQGIYAARATREGRRLVGYKVGLTSREAQKQFQVFRPDFGHLFHDRAISEDSEISLASLIQPKIEGEIAFVLGRDLKGPGVTIVDVLSAVEYVSAAMEIVDSRIINWKITATDTIADNGSSALFVLSGARYALSGLDLCSVGMALWKNGEVHATGAGAAVMGNPLSSIVFLANELGKFDRGLLAGEMVLSGSLSSMLPVKAGDSFLCEMAHLGNVRLRFAKGDGDATHR